VKPRTTSSIVRRSSALTALGVALGVLVFAGFGGCRSGSPSPTPPETAAFARDPSPAQPIVERALREFDRDPSKAERLVREALAADPFFGPAHNNLGVLHLRQGRLYDAATSFEEARRLMPGHPDPRLNLALTYERAGRRDEALAAYRAALDAAPGHLPTVQALARLRLRAGLRDEGTRALLRDIALRGDPEWRAWAAGRLADDAGPP
jgi:tetratricopeptide (TPR) repeat protein